MNPAFYSPHKAKNKKTKNHEMVDLITKTEFERLDVVALTKERKCFFDFRLVQVEIN